MPDDDLQAAVDAFRAAQAAIESAEAAVVARRAELPAARARLHEAIADAARAGRRQRDIVAITGYNRETVRGIVRAAGVDAPGDP